MIDAFAIESRNPRETWPEAGHNLYRKCSNSIKGGG